MSSQYFKIRKNKSLRNLKGDIISSSASILPKASEQNEESIENRNIKITTQTQLKKLSQPALKKQPDCQESDNKEITMTLDRYKTKSENKKFEDDCQYKTSSKKRKKSSVVNTTTNNLKADTSLEALMPKTKKQFLKTQKAGIELQNNTQRQYESGHCLRRESQQELKELKSLEKVRSALVFEAAIPDTTLNTLENNEEVQICSGGISKSKKVLKKKKSCLQKGKSFDHEKKMSDGFSQMQIKGRQGLKNKTKNDQCLYKIGSHQYLSLNRNRQQYGSGKAKAGQSSTLGFKLHPVLERNKSFEDDSQHKGTVSGLNAMNSTVRNRLILSKRNSDNLRKYQEKVVEARKNKALSHLRKHSIKATDKTEGLNQLSRLDADSPSKEEQINQARKQEKVLRKIGSMTRFHYKTFVEPLPYEVKPSLPKQTAIQLLKQNISKNSNRKVSLPSPSADSLSQNRIQTKKEQILKKINTPNHALERLHKGQCSQPTLSQQTYQTDPVNEQKTKSPLQTIEEAKQKEKKGYFASSNTLPGIEEASTEQANQRNSSSSISPSRVFDDINCSAIAPNENETDREEECCSFLGESGHRFIKNMIEIETDSVYDLKRIVSLKQRSTTAKVSVDKFKTKFPQDFFKK